MRKGKITRVFLEGGKEDLSVVRSAWEGGYQKRQNQKGGINVFFFFLVTVK